MAETIVAVFDSVALCDAAERHLRESGVSSWAIRRYRPGDANAPSTQTVRTTTPVSTQQHESGGFLAWLFGEDTATTTDYRTEYEEHISSGRTIMAIDVSDDVEAAQVMRLLEQHTPRELEAHGTSDSATAAATTGAMATPRAATTGYTASSAATSTEGTWAANAGQTTGTQTGAEEEVLPLREEQLKVGKRQASNTVRVRRFTTQRPVEENVRLRDERTTIERRAPTSGTAGGDAFEDREIEVRESHEEPTVSKTVKVVEEAVIRKDTTERDETVRDNVRREQVEVNKTDERPARP